MPSLKENLRYRIRLLASRPVVAPSMALGVSAGATVLRWLQSVVLKPIPFVPDSRHDGHRQLLQCLRHSLRRGNDPTAAPGIASARFVHTGTGRDCAWMLGGSVGTAGLLVAFAPALRSLAVDLPIALKRAAEEPARVRISGGCGGSGGAGMAESVRFLTTA